MEKSAQKKPNFPPGTDESLFNAAVETWLASEPPAIRDWIEEAFRRSVFLYEEKNRTGKEVLRHLYDKYGVPPAELLTELVIQKRLREKKLSADAETLSSPEEIAELLQLCEQLQNHPLWLEHLGIAFHVERSAKSLRDLAKTYVGRPKKPEVRSLLLPLIGVLSKYTKKMPWSYVTALASAAFPGFSYADPKKAAYDTLQPERTRLKQEALLAQTKNKKEKKKAGARLNQLVIASDSSLKKSGALPLHQIESREARRAAVELTARHARIVADELSAEQVQRVLDTRPDRKVVKAITTKPNTSICGWCGNLVAAHSQKLLASCRTHISPTFGRKRR